MPLNLLSQKDKKPVYPTKTTINLLTVDHAAQSRGRDIALFVVALVLIAAFAKFGVADVLSDAAASAGKLSDAQAQLSQLEAGNADYALLQDEYAAYTKTGMTEEEQTYADRSDVLAVLQDTVENAASLQMVTVKGNAVSLQFTSTTLDDASNVVAALEDNPLVQSVSMSTARTDKNNDVVSTVTVILVGSGTGSVAGTASTGTNSTSTATSTATTKGA